MAKATKKQDEAGAAALKQRVPNVTYKREELRKVIPQYKQVRDVLAGAIAVKSKGELYLPMPSPEDRSKANVERYNAYKNRAVFYGVTERTLKGFVGEIFDKDPVIEVPPGLQHVTEDATGQGTGITQLAKRACEEVLSMGRGGLLTDYPTTDGAITVRQKEAGDTRAVIHFYTSEQIINWRVKKVGALTVLTLLVLEETYDKEDDGFEKVKDTQWRVLRLGPDNVVRAWLYQGTGASGLADGYDEAGVVLRKADGTPFDKIPFAFIGSEQNEPDPTKPPLFDLSEINLGHYRNSADYEESCFICGQPTAVIVGLTEAWADKYFKEGVPLGARAALPLPVGADAKLLQAEPNTMPKEAMEAKERQMVALGAKLVEQAKVQRTATEASAETASEMSVLATVADNVSIAFQWALGYAADYEGVSEKNITFRLNKEFAFNYASPEAVTAVISAWQSEAISFTEMRAAIRKAGFATQQDAVAKAEILDDAAIGIGVPDADPNADQTNPPDPQNVKPDSNQVDEV